MSGWTKNKRGRWEPLSSWNSVDHGDEFAEVRHVTATKAEAAKVVKDEADQFIDGPSERHRAPVELMPYHEARGFPLEQPPIDNRWPREWICFDTPPPKPIKPVAYAPPTPDEIYYLTGLRLPPTQTA